MADLGLSPREEAAWRGFNEMRNLLVPRISRELVADAGLTEADYAVLLAIVESPGRTIRSRALLKRLQWEPSRLSHQIKRMESRGTVTRRRCDGDGRSFDVLVTEAGLDAMRQAAPGHLEAVRRWFVDALSTEQLDALADASAAVVAHIEAVDAREPDAGERPCAGAPDPSGS